MNAAADGTGVDMSTTLDVSAVYDSTGADYTLLNGGGADGYITYLTARGKGVYQYNPIEISVDDAASQAAYGYLAQQIQQKYQQDLAAGKATATVVIANEAAARTELNSVTICANYSEFNMRFCLNCDVGDLIQVTHVASGINAKY